MKQFFLLIILVVVLMGCSKKEAKIVEDIDKIPEVVVDAQGFKLVWADEFSGTAINTNNWSYQVESAGRFNNEWQAYTNSPENAYIENGNMVIAAKYNGNGLAKGNFTSARMITQGKQNFKYGKISARIKVPYGQGIWPAFWMLGSNIKENNPDGTENWPYCGEIDIMEKIGGGTNEKKVWGTLHYFDEILGKNPMPGGTKILPYNLSDEFHTYEIEWDANTMIWKFDGTEYHRIVISSSVFSEFRKDFYILLNLAVGGGMPGNPDSSTVFPQKMLIDWVRVYQK